MFKSLVRWTSAAITLTASGFSVLATVYESDGSSSNLQSIHDTLAQNGDTITLPAGTFTWTQTVNLSKNISIVGVTGQTTINDQISKTAGSPGAFRCNLPSGATLFRISGIKFQGTVGPAYTGSLGEISLDGVSATPNVRIDNCQLNGLYLRPIVFFGGLWGVIDHCGFTMGPWVGGIDVRHSGWKGIGSYGDNSWADDPRWGSEQAIFIEDCVFNNFSGATFIDGDGGMRVVVRHCTIYGSEAGNHGTETGQRNRSGRTFEFYQNQCDGGPSTFNHNPNRRQRRRLRQPLLPQRPRLPRRGIHRSRILHTGRIRDSRHPNRNIGLYRSVQSSISPIACGYKSNKIPAHTP